MRTENTPFFIIGCHRSGTSLMREILRRHSRLFIPVEETAFMYKLFGNHRLIKIPIEKSHLPQLVGLFSVFTVDGTPILGHVQVNDLIADLALQSPFDDLKTFVDALFSTIACRHHKVRWGDKSPMHTVFLDRLMREFPEAPIIHCVRDGRDVVASLQAKMKKGNEPEESVAATALHWRYYVQCARRYRQSQVKDNILTVHYEKLTAEPEKTLHIVCDHLGETFEPSMLQIDYSNTSYRRRSEESGIRPATRGKWRDLLDAREQQVMLSILEQELITWGYQAGTSLSSLAFRDRWLTQKEIAHFNLMMLIRRTLSGLGMLDMFRNARISRREVGPQELK